MDNQIKRMIKGADRDHRSDGFELRECNSARRRRVQAHGNDAAAFRTEHFDAVLNTIGGTIDLDQ